jgi:Putative Ig domain
MPVYSNVQEFSIEVGGTDVTDYVKSFSFRYPIADFNNPLILSGQITLKPTRTGDLDLNDETEVLWAKGANPVIFSAKGSHILTGRISSAFYDDTSKELKLDITDKLGLVWGSEQAGIPPVSRGKVGAVKLSAIVTELIQYGSEVDGQATLSFGGGLGASGEQEVPIYPQAFQGGALKLAQLIASERGFWLWCNKAETVQAVSYNGGQSYQLGEKKLIGFQRYKATSETPADVVKVVGSYEAKLVCPDDQITVTEEFDTNENGQKILIRRTTEEVTKSRFSETISTSVSTAFNVAFDDLPEDLANRTSLVPTSNETTIRLYNRGEGRLYRVFTDGLTANGLYKSLRTILDVGQWYQLGVRKTYKEDYVFDKISGVVVEKNIEEKVDKIGLITLPADQYSGVGDGLVTRVLQNETWQDSVCNKFVYKIRRYERKVSRTAVLKGLSQVLGQRQNNVDPPTGDVNDPEEARETRVIEEKVRVSGNDGGPAKTEEVLEAKTIIDKEGLQNYARLYATIQRQRQKAGAVAHEVTKFVASSFKPFMGATIKDGYFIIDSPSFTGESGKLTFGFIGNKVGSAIAPITPAIKPYLPVPGLQIAALPDVTAYVGVAIDPITLGAQKGVLPYTFSASGLPTGVTLSGNLISGIPTTAGSYTVTVDVIDSAATTDSTTFVITVTELVPIPSYEFYVSWGDFTQTSLIDADIDDIVPLPDTVLGGVQVQGGQIIPGANLNWFAQTESSWAALNEEAWNNIEE